MPDTIYIRKDDPVETVRIVSQEKTPGGIIRFEFLSPPAAKGTTAATGGHVFHSLYKNANERDTANDVPPRPHSSADRDSWRTYALWLEREYGHFHVEPSPQTPIGDPDTLGPVGRKARR